MPRGDKSSYTDKQRRMAEHIEQGCEKRGGVEGMARDRASPCPMTRAGKRFPPARDFKRSL
jgi:hypothetical protein